MTFKLEIVADAPPPLCEIERVAIRHRLYELNWHLSKTAKSLNITRVTLRKKMRAYNITERSTQ